MSRHSFIHLDGDGAKVKSFKTASRAKSTVITVEIEVTDSYALGDLLRQLHEAKNPPPPPKPEPKAKAAPKALPAPPLQLADMRRLDL